MFKFITKVPYWYLIAIPLLSTFLGTASNQAVLIANGDKFPVMANAEKLQRFCVKDEPVESQVAKKIKAAVDKIQPKPAVIEKPKITAPAVRMQAPDPYTCGNGGEFLDTVHVVMTPQSHLRFLADIFDLHVAIFSIGDFLLMFGDWMWEWAGIAWLALIIRKLLAKD